MLTPPTYQRDSLSRVLPLLEEIYSCGGLRT
jgi:hypothetical protein